MSQDPETLLCHDVALALACTKTMETYAPCHFLQFDNVTFDNAVLVLNEYRSALCVDEVQEERSECESIFPNCFTSMVEAEETAKSCREAQERRSCLKQLTVSIACRDSPHAQKFTDLRRTDKEFLREKCDKVHNEEVTFGSRSRSLDAPNLKVGQIQEKDPNAGIMLYSSLVLLLASLMVSYLQLQK